MKAELTKEQEAHNNAINSLSLAQIKINNSATNASFLSRKLEKKNEELKAV